MDDQDAEIIDRALSGKDVSRREILGAGGAALFTALAGCEENGNDSNNTTTNTAPPTSTTTTSPGTRTTSQTPTSETTTPETPTSDTPTPETPTSETPNTPTPPQEFPYEDRSHYFTDLMEYQYQRPEMGGFLFSMLNYSLQREQITDQAIEKQSQYFKPEKYGPIKLENLECRMDSEVMAFLMDPKNTSKQQIEQRLQNQVGHQKTDTSYQGRQLYEGTQGFINGQNGEQVVSYVEETENGPVLVTLDKNARAIEDAYEAAKKSIDAKENSQSVKDKTSGHRGMFHDYVNDPNSMINDPKTIDIWFSSGMNQYPEQPWNQEFDGVDFNTQLGSDYLVTRYKDNPEWVEAWINTYNYPEGKITDQEKMGEFKSNDALGGIKAGFRGPDWEG